MHTTLRSNEDTGGATGWSIANERQYYGMAESWTEVAASSQRIVVSGTAASFLAAQEFDTLKAAGNDNPMGIWSDGTTMWVAHRPETEFGDTSLAKLFAYNMVTKQRDSAKGFNTLDAAGNGNPRGLWSDGSTMWVVDRSDEKIYAYDMATKARVPGEDFNNLDTE